MGLPHRLEFPVGLLNGWSEVLADYEILQPFSQLDREIAILAPEDLDGHQLVRYRKKEVPTFAVLGLEGKRWVRGPALDGGCAAWMVKDLGDSVFAKLRLDPGLIVGDPTCFPEQILQEVVLDQDPDGWSADPVFSCQELHPVSLSELLTDLDIL